MNTSTITSACYLGMVRRGCAHLHASKEVINDLNVFPIPDGDTGDNMFMTINSGCQNVSLSDNLGDTAESISSGMLLGARGNSGVILSRIFAGIGKGLAGVGQADLPAFKAAMAEGVEESYKAVSVPVEGTILTVFREGVQKAADKPADCLEDYFAALIPEMEASLEHTPELLPTLKEAGVIDSGGAGILSIVRGMAEALDNPQDIDLPDNPAPEAAHGKIDLSAFGPDDELEFGYCTEFLLRLQTSKVDLDTFDAAEIRDYLTAVGESVVCFREDSIVKVHVHTKTPGEILNHCQRWGEYLTLKIENMALQHNETELRKQASEEPEFKIHKHIGIVTVASGEGLVQTLLEAGADEVIRGGQTMNPSALDFVVAFKKTAAETIFVYPNNSNIVMTALQAASLFEESKVIVIPTKTVPQGVTALLNLNVDDTETQNVENMTTAIGGVHTAMITYAARDSEFDGRSIKAGEHLALIDGALLDSFPDVDSLFAALGDAMEAMAPEFITIYYGADVQLEDAEEASLTLKTRFPDAELSIVRGGQPVYYYMIAIE